MDESRKLQLLRYLVGELCAERNMEVPEARDAGELWSAFRALVNTRPPWPQSEDLLAAQDELLRGLIRKAGIHGIDEATPSPTDAGLLLWRGDITTLATDAIVNAANSQMLGCWVPATTASTTPSTPTPECSCAPSARASCRRRARRRPRARRR